MPPAAGSGLPHRAARFVRRRTARSPLLTAVTESGWQSVHRATRARKIRSYAETTDLFRLMIGAGPAQQPGWLATDLIPSRPDVVLLDAGGRFPFPTSSVDFIHSEHMIEHIDHDLGAHMLRECARVLKPGGRIRILTPDIDRVLALSRPPSPDVAELATQSTMRSGVPAEDATDPIYAINRLFSGYGHRFLYSEEALRRALSRAGFNDLERFEPGVSNDPQFRGVDAHGEHIDPDWNRYHTMALEGRCPKP